jgi:hypothetical protein
VQTTHLIRQLRRQLHRWLPPNTTPPERPAYVAPAAAAFTASWLLLLLHQWPLSLFFAPALVLGCRYHELAQFRLVRRSRWAFLLVLASAVIGTMWTLSGRAWTLWQPVTLLLAIGSMAAAAHLFATQRRLLAVQARESLLTAVDDDAPRWSCGGLLAMLPVLFLFGCVDGLASWRTPMVLLWGIGGTGALLLQVRGHWLFPRVAIAWLLVWLALETHGTFAAEGESGDDALVTYGAVVALTGSLAAYLLLSPRVRRTFERTEVTAARAAVAALPLAAIGEPTAPVERVG